MAVPRKGDRSAMGRSNRVSCSGLIQAISTQEQGEDVFSPVYTARPTDRG